jgi:gliding motility-associated-like protein
MLTEDFEADFEDFEIDTFEVLDMEEVELEVTDTIASFQPYCDYPPVPIPTFQFPDTLCAGESAVSLSDANRLAQAREWHLTGSGIDSVLRDSYEFAFTFHQPGKYMLQQSVWVLGCRKDYERSITVLPPLEVAIVGDTIICPDDTPYVQAEANRTAAYLWANGQEGAISPVWSSGDYAVTATDGYCSASETAYVSLITEQLAGNPPFMLPNDTVTCLPFELLPRSLFTDYFFTEFDPTPVQRLFLNKAGTYRIGATVLGCTFWQLYEYGVDCQADLYLPNSFSPNNDGINDVFQPYGDDFEVLELLVFDRWGGLRYKGKAWDGGAAVPGVYLYKLTYLNLKSGEQVEQSGEVTLVR